MRRAPALVLAFVLGAALLSLSAAPALAGDDVPSVEVTGLKNPEMGSYRSVAAGLDVFDRERALAPGATLRFHIMRAGGGSATADDGLALKLASDDGSVPVPIGADGRFVVERSQDAWDADATFILNRKNGLYHPFPEVRTPGLPGTVRRLGDLRLQCRVMVAIAKERMSFMAKAAMNTLFLSSDWCARQKVTWSFPAEMRLDGATLRHAERSTVLATKEWSYAVPIGDPSWPDDALVELNYAPASP